MVGIPLHYLSTYLSSEYKKFVPNLQRMSPCYYASELYITWKLACTYVAQCTILAISVSLDVPKAEVDCLLGSFS